MIRLYNDGTSIGGTTTVAGGTWTISGLAASTLYAGGAVTATAQGAGKCEGDVSAAKIVQCIVPLNTPALNPTTATICSGQTVSAKVTSSQVDVIYQFYNGGVASGGSKTGTGGTIFLKSAGLTASTTLTIRASKLSPPGCNNTLTASLIVTVTSPSACDKDSDGLSNEIDLDTDNDGIPNANETGSTTVYNPIADLDVDGFIDYKDNDGWSHCCIVDPGFPAWTDANTDGINDRFDKDGDGISDFLDFDSDNDGMTDCLEAGGTDADGNGIIDGYADSDNDGLANSVDATTGGVPLSLPDSDGDGLKNYQDLDSDGDGIPDLRENKGTDSNNDGKIDLFVDTDGDGQPDTVDPTNGGTALTIVNSDNITGPNYIDLDSDNDGIFDLREADVSLPVSDKDANNDGKLDVTTDANNDGLADAMVTSPFPYLDVDGDGQKDFMDTDSDGDGLKDYKEGFDDDNNGASLNDYIVRGTATGKVAYSNVDDNGNGYPNYLEDAYSDGIPNFLDADNLTYYLDSDADGLVDFFDVNSSGANAKKPFPDFNSNGVPSFRDPAESVVLPVELVEFYGMNENNKNNIYWVTASEQNNDYFILEHSTSGNNFNKIALLYGAGNSTELRTYVYGHSDPSSGMNYYRLKQKDYDGKCSYSGMIVIVNEEREEINKIYVNEQNGIFIDMFSQIEKNSCISIINGMGAIVYKKQYELSQGRNCFFIEGTAFPPGVYTLSVSNGCKCYAKKFIISKR